MRHAQLPSIAATADRAAPAPARHAALRRLSRDAARRRLSRDAARRRLSQNVLWSWAAWLASVAAPLILVPLSVRYLGPRIYGEWLIILSLTSYLGLANLGLGQTVGNRVAAAYAHGRRSEVGVLVSTAFVAYTAVAVVLLVALALLAPWLTHDRFAAGDHAARACLVYLALVALAFPGKAHQMMLRGYERVACEQALETGATLARIVLVAGVLLAGGKLIAVATINGGAALAAALGATLWAIRLEPAARPRLVRYAWPTLRAMLAPSAAFFALQAGWTMVLGIDNLVIGATLGAAAVTRYAVSFRFIWIAAAAFSVAVNALTPTVTGHYVRARRSALVRGYLLALRLAMLYATLGAVALWIVGPRLLIALAGPAVYPGRATFAMQIAAFFLLVWNVPSSTILWATSRHYRWALLTLAEGLLNLALSLCWVRLWGIAGVIAATLAAAALTNGWYITAAALRTLELRPHQLLRALGPGATLSAAALATLTRGGGLPTPAPAHLAVTAAGALGFAMLYSRIVFSAAERGALYRWMRPAAAAVTVPR